MSTEQQEHITSENETVQAIAAQMLDGRDFRGVSPLRWRPDIRRIIPEVIAELAQRRESLTGATDLGIGQEFERAIRSRVTFGGYADSVQEVFGAWLREKAALFEGKPAIPDYPEPPGYLAAAHQQQIDRLREWADNPEDDLMDGVDAQAQHLVEFPQPAWPTDECRTRTEAKDFLGRVMDYKRARLARLVPTEAMMLLVDERLNQGAYFVLGTVIEVVSVGRNEFGARGICDFGDGNGRQQDSQTLLADNLRQYHLVAEPVRIGSESEPEAVEEPETTATAGMSVLQMVEELTNLRTRVEELTHEVSRLQQQHQADIDMIGTTLIEEAQRRDWCDEYDRVIERLNMRLSTPLPVREDSETDYEVEVSGYVRVPFALTVSVTLSAGSDSDEIEEAAREVFEANYSASNLLDSYSDRYSAEVEDEVEYSIN